MSFIAPRPKIYLAGPSVFRPDAIQYGERLKALCRNYGFDGLYPTDPGLGDPARGGVEIARAIRDANLTLVRQSVAVLVDMTPFRGPGMDGGTAFEMGYAAALGLPIVAWSDVRGTYKERVLPGVGGDLCPAGLIIEDFGLPDNLMMASGLIGDQVYHSPQEALWTLEMHLKNKMVHETTSQMDQTF